MPKIVVTINKLGDSKVEVEGETGGRCVEMTASVEAALAGNPGARHLKPEFDEASGSSASQSQTAAW
ncbi:MULTISPECIES: DUF2997 domain-containing protein [unclassified Bradyrhizobium]|uniref:DUF2997 domain-containing protein n=1 Tax=unclassified Bradyrhizobium TaxID=2631580 RepID=UPI003398989C